MRLAAATNRAKSNSRSERVHFRENSLPFLWTRSCVFPLDFGIDLACETDQEKGIGLFNCLLGNGYFRF